MCSFCTKLSIHIQTTVLMVWTFLGGFEWGDWNGDYVMPPNQMHLNRMYLMSVDGLKWWFCWFYASSSTWYRIESSEMIEFDRKDVWNVPINENVQSTQNHQCVCMCTQMSPHSQGKRIKRKDTVYNENVHIIGIIIILASLSYIYDEYNECTVDDTNQYLY